MPRKNPSSHSDEQFALFVEKMGAGLEEIDPARFTEMVRRLIRTDLDATEIIGAAEPMITTHATSGGGFFEAASSAASPDPTAAASHGSKIETPEIAGPPELLPLIGQLVFHWSNSQSLLIRLLALMLETDAPSAAVLFSTLGTTRLRIDLVRRLALLKVSDRQTRHELGKIIDDLDAAGRVRNELIYAMYPVNDRGEITHRQILRFVPTENGAMTFGESQAIDKQRVTDVVVACNNLQLIGRALEQLMTRLKQVISMRGLEQAAD